MKNAKERNLLVVRDKGMLTKIIRFFKNIFGINIASQSITNCEINDEEEKNNSFYEAIKFKEDPDKVKLLEVQEELERRGINLENAIELTKDLSNTQRHKLENLYKEQIKELEQSIRNYKNKIVSIRKKLAQDN